LIPDNPGSEVQIQSPLKPGAYRLFVYAHDGHGRGAYANIPFYVDGASTAATAASNDSAQR
jgi:hypothetical protein